MKNIETPRTENPDFSFKNLTQNNNKNILRCLGDSSNLNEKCYEIPFQELYYTVQINEKTKIKKIDNIYIKLQCPIHLKHNNFILLDTFLKDEDNRNKFSKIKCICNNEKINHQKLYYCIKDKIFLGEHLYEQHINHSDFENYLIDKEKFDSYCKFHNSKINKYCSICKKNLCNQCVEIHKKNHLKQLNNNEVFIKEFYNEINNCNVFNNRIKEANNFFKKMNQIFNFVISICQNKSLMNDIKKYININSLMFNYLKEVYYFYNEGFENNNLNYQIIFNYKNILQKFSIPKIFECYETNAKYIKLFKDYINDINNYILKIDEKNNEKYESIEEDNNNNLNFTGISNGLEEENNEEVIENNKNIFSKSVIFDNKHFKFKF